MLESTCNPIFLEVIYPAARRRQILGGAKRDRTADPLLAKQVLSQLSYSPAPVVLFLSLTAVRPAGWPARARQTIGDGRSA